MVLGDPERRLLADRCGARLVAAQGPLGQWWWHHDAAAGRWRSAYPVYVGAPAQHGADGAARAGVAGGRSHAAAVTSSRAWLHANELGLDLVEPASGIIWRSIEREEGPPRSGCARPACWPACPGRSPGAAPSG